MNDRSRKALTGQAAIDAGRPDGYFTRGDYDFIQRTRTRVSTLAERFKLTEQQIEDIQWQRLSYTTLLEQWFPEGSRVQLVEELSGDFRNAPAAGEHGTVLWPDDSRRPKLHVNWDGGSTLAVFLEEDQVRLLETISAAAA